MDNFSKKSSYQQTKSLINMLRKLARVNDVNTVMYSLDPTHAIHVIPKNMVRTRVAGNLRMRKQNNMTTVPLDQSVVRIDFPRDFGPLVAFVT